MNPTPLIASTFGGGRARLALALGVVALGLALVISLMPSPEAHARDDITTMTVRYRDFGFGSPASITLVREQGKAHIAPGGDNNHGPISFADSESFTITTDAGEDKIGTRTEFRLTGPGGTITIKIHTSCSQPIDIGFLYGDDGDDRVTDPSEFVPNGGSLNAAIEILGGDGCLPPARTNTPTPSDTPTPTNTPTPSNTPTPTNTPTPPITPTPTNPPEELKNLIAGCVMKGSLPSIVPDQCKRRQGEAFTAVGIVNFGQDFDKDGIAGYRQVTISATWPEELNPVKQVHFQCPESPSGGTVVPTIVRADPPTTLTCALNAQSLAAGHELAGEAWLAVTLNCSDVGFFQVRFDQEIIREDGTPVPAKKTLNDVTKLTITCNPPQTGTPTPSTTPTPSDTPTGTPPTQTPTRTPCPKGKVPIANPGCGTPTPSHTPPKQTPPTQTPPRTPCPEGKVPIANPGCGTPTPSHTPPKQTPPTQTPPTQTPTRTPCPEGQVPVNGSCATPTNTPTATATKVIVTRTPTTPRTPTATPGGNVPGDVDCNFRTDARDAVIILQFVARVIRNLPCLKNVDVNCDGFISVFDATIILQFTVNFFSELPHCSEKRHVETAAASWWSDAREGVIGVSELLW